MEMRDVKKIAATVCICAAVLFLVFLGIRLLPKSGAATPSPEPGLEVPNFVGMKWPELSNDREMRAQYLFTIVEGSDSDAETGEILDQEPKPGSAAVMGQRVELTVNGGAEVPEMLRYERDDATKLLDVLGLKYKIMEEDSDDVDKGCVIGTEPVAGTVIDFGSEVTLKISKGKKKVRVPNVYGMDEKDAIKVLTDDGFTVRVESVADGTVQPGQVSESSPRGNTMAEAGSEVIIRVNNGSADKKVKVPQNLVGKDLNSVTRALSEAGLVVGRVTLDDESEEQKDVVTKLGTPSGTELKEGDSVDLVVSSGKGAPKQLNHKLKLPDVEGSVELKTYVNGVLTENVIATPSEDDVYWLSYVGKSGRDVVMVTLDDSVYAQLTFDYDTQSVDEEILMEATPTPSATVTPELFPTFSPFFN